MHVKFNLVILILLSAFFIACSNKSQKEYVIGFSQCMTDDVWRQAMDVEMNIEASNYDNLLIISKDAKENNKLQIKQIKELINKKVDVLIISPNESDYITPVAIEAYRAGIPTIIVDRKINSEEYTSYVGGNSYEIGKMAGEYASSLLPNGATILEIWGTKTTSPAQERHNGFIDGLDKMKKFQHISIEGKWRREITEIQIDKIKNFSQIDLVYAHNDIMALEVRDAIMKSDSTLIQKIKFLGVDGAFGKGAGLEAVANELLNASFLYPTGGSQVIKVAMKIIQGQPVDKQYILNTALIDKATASTLLMQANQLIDYQKKIEQQRSNINNILNKFSILKYSLTTILVLMSILIAFAIYIYYINKKIRKRNIQLRLKNIETEKQKEQLITLNEQIKEITDQKVRFFMNVSHEVKTPLTLILSPIEKWIKKSSDLNLQTDLLRMKKNADRLTRVIDQLLDFQKIESNKIRLNLSKKNIVSFTLSIKSLFDGLAESRNINFTFESNKSAYYLDFDEDKIEKVLVNLLSNAFKFTPDFGKISLHVLAFKNKIIISVIDNGSGINKDKLPYIFDRFYTDHNKNTNNVTGTGIGLHLSQEFVKLHGGNISVQSIPNSETIFMLELPIRENNSKSNFSKKEEYFKSIHPTLPDINNEISNTILNKKYDYSILIVEDDEEIREYLSNELSNNFQVICATNGIEALQIINQNNNITLVLSDVLMPEMNGFELCRNLKSTFELSHIPIILLTALSEIDQRIYGIAEGADDYIQKPFQIDFVKIKIIRLIKERRQLQKKFMRTMQISGTPQINNDIELIDNDKLFLNRFVEQLEFSFSDSNISIEKISENLGVSRVHLYRKIKGISGLTPVDYLRNFRLAKAVVLLDQQRFTISEIAYQTGFSSPAYFSKCFKELFNMTPSDYIKKNDNQFE